MVKGRRASLRADRAEPGEPAVRRLAGCVVLDAVHEHHEGAVLLLPPVLLHHRLCAHETHHPDSRLVLC